MPPFAIAVDTNMEAQLLVGAIRIAIIGHNVRDEQQGRCNDIKVHGAMKTLENKLVNRLKVLGIPDDTAYLTESMAYQRTSKEG